MKTEQLLFVKSLIILLVFTFPQSVYSQEVPGKAADFKWEIKFDKNRIIIKCEEGCAYTNLSFSSNRAVTLNQFGMVDLTKNPNEESKSEFLIAYLKKGKTVTLKGIKGVTWTELSFTEGKSIYILDEVGVMIH